MIEKAPMIQRRFANIITYLRFRITNAASESINSKIQWVKCTARGFRSKKNFVTANPLNCPNAQLSWVPKKVG
jgi:transposase